MDDKQGTPVPERPDGTIGPETSTSAPSAVSPPQSNARHGARKKARTEEVVLTPGKVDDPTSFLQHPNEQQCSAYVGFSELTDFRKFLLTWPVLRAFIQTAEIIENRSRRGAYKILRTKNLELHDDPSNHPEYALREDDDSTTRRSKGDHQLALHLLTMEHDIKRMCEADAATNQLQQQKYFATFVEQMPSWDNIARLQFSETGGDTPLIDDKHVLIWKMPTLGPLSGESRLESINRCWTSLQSLRYRKQQEKSKAPTENFGIAAFANRQLSALPTTTFFKSRVRFTWNRRFRSAY